MTESFDFNKKKLAPEEASAQLDLDLDGNKVPTSLPENKEPKTDTNAQERWGKDPKTPGFIDKREQQLPRGDR